MPWPKLRMSARKARLRCLVRSSPASTKVARGCESALNRRMSIAVVLSEPDMTTVILAKKVSAPSGIPAGGHLSAAEYLQRIGVPEIPPCTAPFDPGYDSATIEGHLDQSAGLIEILKISMSCWVIAD